MPSPNVPQGTLNKLAASLVIPALPSLNVTASFLDVDGLGIAFEGEAGFTYPTLTGTVTSPEPYQLCTIMARLLRTQPLADQYKRQLETSVLLGDVTVRPDTRTLSPYEVMNCQIVNVGELTFNGRSAGFGVSIKGYYPINSSLWDG